MDSNNWFVCSSNVLQGPNLVSLASIVLTSMISIVHIATQVKYNHGNVISRNCIIMIVGIVPLYALQGYLITLNQQLVLRYITLVKEIYDGFVIYALFRYFMEQAGGLVRVITNINEKFRKTTDDDDNHDSGLSVMQRCLMRFKCVSTRYPAEQVYCQIRFFILQYGLIKSICALIPFISSFVIPNHVFDSTSISVDFDLETYTTYLYIIDGISQMFALYGIVRFYLLVANQLTHSSPKLKLLLVKGVIFVTFWQSLLLIVLVHYHVIQVPEAVSSSNHEFAQCFHYFLVCLEMLVVASLMWCIFPFYENAVDFEHASHAIGGRVDLSQPAHPSSLGSRVSAKETSISIVSKSNSSHKQLISKHDKVGEDSNIELSYGSRKSASLNSQNMYAS